MADHAENAVAILDSVYFPARTQMERSRVAAREAKASSLGVTALAFALALLISIYAVLRLTRPLLADMAVLREGALRLAKGELSHRVAASGAAELSDLATAFNAMAQRIELDQAALAQLATRDGLTGLLNRREILRLLRDELDRSRRYGNAFAVLLLDVDHFKTVNDTWGHPAGDEVLRAVAARIQNEVRPTDKPARYGGEEFMVLLPETTEEGAVLLAERIRSCIAELPAAASAGKPIAVTASVGVAAYPASGGDEEALVSAADRALYRAKAQGRNRVVRADGERR
jgi:diguanylate cyclase (GGDEF)-like protein